MDLGHLLPPYGDDEAPADIPAPHKSVLREAALRWHSDFWTRIVSSAMSDNPLAVDRNFHPAMMGPAVSRYGATSPNMLRWFKVYNQQRSYRDQVKPFGFLLSLRETGNPLFATFDKRTGRPTKTKPIAPFDKDFTKVQADAFDRQSVEPIDLDRLTSYSEALAQYHLSPESKFLNADYDENGVTRRRHIKIANIVHIGKEAHDWERQAAVGLMQDCQFDYGISPDDIAAKVRALVDAFGERQAMKALQLSKCQMHKLLSNAHDSKTLRLRQQVAEYIDHARAFCGSLRDSQVGELFGLRRMIEEIGLRETARRLCIDPSNLRRKLKRLSNF